MLKGGLNNADAPLFDSYSVNFNGSSNYAEVDDAAGDIIGSAGTIYGMAVRTFLWMISG